MPIELVDFNNHPALDPEVGHIKKVLYKSDSYHVWLHVDEPGTTLPSDLASRRRPCASLTLRLHQVG
jgi:hypothetical protein